MVCAKKIYHWPISNIQLVIVMQSTTRIHDFLLPYIYRLPSVVVQIILLRKRYKYLIVAESI